MAPIPTLDTRDGSQLSIETGVAARRRPLARAEAWAEEPLAHRSQERPPFEPPHASSSDTDWPHSMATLAATSAATPLDGDLRKLENLLEDLVNAGVTANTDDWELFLFEALRVRLAARGSRGANAAAAVPSTTASDVRNEMQQAQAAGEEVLSMVDGRAQEQPPAEPASAIPLLEHHAVVAENAKIKAANAKLEAEMVAVERREQEELERVQATIAAETAADECSYFFVSAAHVLASEETTLPSFQALQRTEGALFQRKLRAADVYRGVLNAGLLSVSHRWEALNTPDDAGEQMRAIRAHLKTHPEIVGVWYDFWSMPQDERTPQERKSNLRPDTRSPAERALFKHMLDSVNLLYMGCPVLVLLDISYLSRFWTQFEAWLSMQQCTRDGLRAALASRRRCHIVCLHNATAGNEDVKLVQMWERVTPSEAHALLSKPDVTVTNQSDKDKQLIKITRLDGDVREAWSAREAAKLRAAGVAAADLPLGYAVAALREAGYTEAELLKRYAAMVNSSDAAVRLEAAEWMRKPGLATELRVAGVAVVDLLEIFTVAALREAGYHRTELFKCSVAMVRSSDADARSEAAEWFGKLAPANKVALGLDPAGWTPEVLAAVEVGRLQDSVKRQVQEYMRSTDYDWIWKDDKRAAYSAFVAKGPSLEDVEMELKKYDLVEREINRIPEKHNISALSLDTTPLRTALAQGARTWKKQYAKNLHELAKAGLDNITQWIDTHRRYLLREISDLNDVRMAMGSLTEIKDKETMLDSEFGPVEEKYTLLYKYNVEIPKEESDQVADLTLSWKKLKSEAWSVRTAAKLRAAGVAVIDLPEGFAVAMLREAGYAEAEVNKVRSSDML